MEQYSLLDYQKEIYLYFALKKHYQVSVVANTYKHKMSFLVRKDIKSIPMYFQVYQQTKKEYYVFSMYGEVFHEKSKPLKTVKEVIKYINKTLKEF